MVWFVACLLAFGLAFSYAGNDETPPVPLPTRPTEVAPPPAPAPTMPAWPCKEYDSQDGVKGRLRAVPVEPEHRC